MLLPTLQRLELLHHWQQWLNKAIRILSIEFLLTNLLCNFPVHRSSKRRSNSYLTLYKTGSLRRLFFCGNYRIIALSSSPELGGVWGVSDDLLYNYFVQNSNESWCHAAKFCWTSLLTSVDSIHWSFWIKLSFNSGPWHTPLAEYENCEVKECIIFIASIVTCCCVHNFSLWSAY